MASREKNNQTYVELFSTIFNDVNDVAQFQQFNGISFGYVWKISPTLSLVHNLSMQPRIYSVKEHLQRGEPETPGSYQCILYGTPYDMVFSIKARELWIPEMSLTVPLPDSSLTLTYNIDQKFSSTISAEAVWQHKYFSFEGTCRALDNFSNGAFNLNLATNLKKLRMGLSVSHLLSEKNYALKSVFDFPIKNTTLGASVSTDLQEDLLVTTSARSTFKNTTAGISFHSYPLLLKSDVLIGYERLFLMSKVSTSFSLSGVVSTLYSRLVSTDTRISVSAMADLRSYKYDIGVDLNITPQ